MRSLIRHLFVWLVALAFVASGAAWRHCLAAQQPIPAAVQAHAGHEHTGHDHAAHDHGSHHHAAADQTADDAGQPASSNHDCGKCCSICAISGALPPPPAMTAFETSLAVFASGRDAIAASSFPVDPGIPKRIA